MRRSRYGYSEVVKLENPKGKSIKKLILNFCHFSCTLSHKVYEWYISMVRDQAIIIIAPLSKDIDAKQIHNLFSNLLNESISDAY